MTQLTNAAVVATEPVLEVTEMTRHFGGVAAVDSVSFTVGAGEIVGLIGPNGAGKSTTINCISGLLSLSHGSVRCGGADISRLPAHRVAQLGLARTFQTSRLFSEMTVSQNVEVGALFGSGERGSASARRVRVTELLHLVGLEKLGGARADSLSYGDQRRLEIARALAIRPRVLLLDEPVAGMHDREAHGIGQLLVELAAGGLAVLLVEHNMRFVVSVAGRLHVLDHGREIANGPTAEVLKNPEVIRAYLGGSHA